MDFLLVLAADESVLQMQVTTWLQVAAGIASLIGTAAYVGSKMGRMETKIDSHFVILEGIATRLEKDLSVQEKQLRAQEQTLQVHEVQLAAVNVSIGHLEQQISGKKSASNVTTARKAHT